MEKKKKIKEGDQLKSSEKTAEKIFKVWVVLTEFNEEDIENLRKVVAELKEQSGKLRAIGGILTDLDRSDYQIEVNDLRIKRTNALLNLLENQLGKKDIEIGQGYLEKKGQQESINKMFGL